MLAAETKGFLGSKAIRFAEGANDNSWVQMSQHNRCHEPNLEPSMQNALFRYIASPESPIKMRAR